MDGAVVCNDLIANSRLQARLDSKFAGDSAKRLIKSRDEVLDFEDPATVARSPDFTEDVAPFGLIRFPKW